MRLPISAFSWGILLSAVFFSSTQASTRRHDLTWDDYAFLAEDVSSTVGLIYEYTASGTYIGSGSVIASSDSGSWVITAAHVVQDATAREH